MHNLYGDCSMKVECKEISDSFIKRSSVALNNDEVKIGQTDRQVSYSCNRLRTFRRKV